MHYKMNDWQNEVSIWNKSQALFSVILLNPLIIVRWKIVKFHVISMNMTSATFQHWFQRHFSHSYFGTVYDFLCENKQVKPKLIICVIVSLTVSCISFDKQSILKYTTFLCGQNVKIPLQLFKLLTYLIYYWPNFVNRTPEANFPRYRSNDKLCENK